MEKLLQVLNCTFTVSYMLLGIESDASYLSVVKARTCATGIFKHTNIPAAPTTNLTLNGAGVHVLCHIMRR